MIWSFCVISGRLASNNIARGLKACRGLPALPMTSWMDDVLVGRGTPCAPWTIFSLVLCDFELADAAPALEFPMSSIAENLERVREQIASSAARSGRSADDVELVAITKTHPAEKVREAIEAAQTLFGESRVQEARAKIPELPSTLRWHFVGHLQKNKVRQALPLFEMIHSVDSLALAQDMNRIAEEEGLHPRVLLEVNVAGEGTKFGFAPNKLRQQMEELLALPRLSIEGLMCIPPLADESEPSRKCFAQLRELRDSLANEFDVKLPQLSMGMTNDFPIAVEEGATLVRVGTAIFGERSKANREL
jgi:pyridoxal phosphate enzyme (YggS family)